MLIQRSSHTTPGKSKFDQFFIKLASLLAKTRLRYLFLLMLLGAFGLSGIYYGIELHRTKEDWTTRRTLSHFVKSSVRIPTQYIQGKLSSPEVIDISIKHMNYMELAYKRSQAWEKGKITEEEKTGFVSVKILHNDDSLKAKVRLKGLFLDHLHKDKWSLRVRLKGKNTLFGMKQFSLQAPHTRNFIHEWIYHQALRSLGLMALDFRFVDVRLNGKNLGIFSMEEHFDKSTAVNNQRAEGFFVKPWNSSVAIYGESRILEDPKLSKKILILKNDYQLFLAGKLKASELFDWEKTAKYFAVQDLFSAEHGDILGNFVCYYNPVTLKLEPIGYDANAGFGTEIKISPIALPKKDKFYQRLFQDPVILAAYVKESRKLGSEWIKNFLNSIDSELKENLKILYKEHPEYYLNLDYLTNNQKAITKVLNATNENDIVINPTYRIENNKMVVLLSLLDQALPVEILGIWNGNKLIAKPKQPFLLGHNQERSRVSMAIVEHTIKNEIENSEEKALQIKYRVVGELAEHNQPIYPALSNDNPLPLLLKRFSKQLRSLSFIVVDDENKRVYVEQGNHKLTVPLVIPEGYKLEITKGTTLDLNNSAVIFSQGPVSLIGDSEQPIIITSTDGSGGGIVVMEAREQSILRNVIVEKQKTAVIGSFKPSGSVFFYESPVLIDNGIIRDIDAEDGVNIVRSEFEIRNTVFRKCASDALDVDFGTGKVLETVFIETGNDALDFSGSKIELVSVKIQGAGDKGVSAGEKSEVHAVDLDINDTVIGLASKDLSTLFVKNSIINNSKYCMAVYQKKPVFGPGEIVADKVTIRECEMRYAVEKGATLKHEGKDIESNIKNARKLFYGK